MNAFLIKNGAVYHPDRHGCIREDVAVENGRIAQVEPGKSYVEIDAQGCILTPGLIDYHVHYFHRGTENGVSPDTASFPCGITTAVDGGSCGAANYELYRQSVMAHSDVRILNFLLMASGGQVTDRYPERLDAEYFDKDKIRHLFGRYPGNLVGLKTRMSRGIIHPDKAGQSLAETVDLAGELGCPVAVHVTDPVMDLEKLAGILRPGDIVCHCYQGKGTETILNRDGTVRAGILEARKRGVLFDASNGRNNYDLKVCCQALAQGFAPDIISSDMNTCGLFLQPLHSLPRIMSKYLALGMALEDVLDAVTLTPARLLHREELASMEVGTTADLAVLRVVSKDLDYSDMAGHRMKGSQAIVPQMTMKGGKIVYCQADFN